MITSFLRRYYKKGYENIDIVMKDLAIKRRRTPFI